MAVTITYFVHGTTTDNENKLSTGWLDGQLSEKGIKQSIELKNKILIQDFDMVFCSDLKRAIDSANYTFKGEKQIKQDPRIRECNYGLLNGKDSKLVVYEDHILEEFPQGESLIQVEERVRDFVQYLRKEYDGRQVAIVAHKAPQLALEVILNHKSWEQAIEEDWRKTKNWKPGWLYIA